MDKRIQRGAFALLVAGLIHAGCAATVPHQEVAWERLPAAQSEAGRPAGLLQGDLILQGSAIRSVPVYRAPVTIDLDCWIETRSATNGELRIQLEPAKAHDRPGVSFRWRYEKGRPDVAVVDCMQSESSTDGNEPRAQPSPPLAPVAMHRVELQVHSDQIQVTIDGCAFTVPCASIPDRDFRITLQSQPAADRWHIRQFLVH
jgi:hypothetical protein